MKFTGTFIGAKIDIAQYENKLKKHLRSQLRNIAKAWLEGATGRVPIWSGMSQASLLKLAELVNEPLVISPKGNVPSRIPEGRILGTAIENLDLKDFNITIITDVPHYNVQEFKNVGVSKSAPWHSLKSGQAMAKPVLDRTTLLKPLIKPIQFKVK
ncbi:MAG: hypothetical protein WC942_03930 [Clostridia bacterium]